MSRHTIISGLRSVFGGRGLEPRVNRDGAASFMFRLPSHYGYDGNESAVLDIEGAVEAAISGVTCSYCEKGWYHIQG